jgi:hypothetical protein
MNQRTANYGYISTVVLKCIELVLSLPSATIDLNYNNYTLIANNCYLLLFNVYQFSINGPILQQKLNSKWYFYKNRHATTNA